MRLTPAIAAIAVFLTTTACIMEDAGPTQTATDAIDLGKAETVHTEIHMGAGTLKLEGGAASLMTGSYRFSEKIGRPVARYDVTGASGRLTLNSPKGSSSKGNNVNEWDVRMSSEVPMDVTVALGAGESTLDASHIMLRSLEVDMGAGEMSLNVAGKYTKDVSMQVNGGVGEAKIRLPKDFGAVIEATAGIGSVNANGLTKRDGKYYNDAYAEDKPAIHMNVRGGVGDVTFTVGN